MIQYSENVFSGNMPFEIAHAKFMECLKNGIPVMALHVGTETELDRRKKKADIESEIESLKARMAKLEPAPESELLYIPTLTEAKKFSKRGGENHG